MKIGYACINTTLECKSSSTFRLKNYSEQNLIKTIDSNLKCLTNILEFNRTNDILFFRITSDLIPFGSHPIMQFNWQDYFKDKLKALGNFIKKNNMRITMHPGQYTVLNSKNKTVYMNSFKDLEYHIDILDLMEIDSTAKVQIHVGGVYGEKHLSKKRFIERYLKLEDRIRKRLVIENDDKSYSLEDIFEIHNETEIPLVFDVYHHQCLRSGDNFKASFESFLDTWNKEDGLPITHYSSEHPLKGKCRHADNIDMTHFKNFINETISYNFDIMLEIKDKEKSALKAVKLLLDDPRFNKSIL